MRRFEILLHRLSFTFLILFSNQAQAALIGSPSQKCWIDLVPSHAIQKIAAEFVGRMMIQTSDNPKLAEATGVSLRLFEQINSEKISIQIVADSSTPMQFVIHRPPEHPDLSITSLLVSREFALSQFKTSLLSREGSVELSAPQAKDAASLKIWIEALVPAWMALKIQEQGLSLEEFNAWSMAKLREEIREAQGELTSPPPLGFEKELWFFLDPTEKLQGHEIWANAFGVAEFRSLHALDLKRGAGHIRLRQALPQNVTGIDEVSLWLAAGDYKSAFLELGRRAVHLSYLLKFENQRALKPSDMESLVIKTRLRYYSLLRQLAQKLGPDSVGILFSPTREVGLLTTTSEAFIKDSGRYFNRK
ncbi:MAG: hypothetical protein AB1540_07915 [Bdellovibrionota bacterium]